MSYRRGSYAPEMAPSCDMQMPAVALFGRGPQGPRGPVGPQGPKGEKGDTYVLTQEDMEDIVRLIYTLLDYLDEIAY